MPKKKKKARRECFICKKEKTDTTRTDTFCEGAKPDLYVCQECCTECASHRLKCCF